MEAVFNGYMKAESLCVTRLYKTGVMFTMLGMCHNMTIVSARCQMLYRTVWVCFGVFVCEANVFGSTCLLVSLFVYFSLSISISHSARARARVCVL